MTNEGFQARLAEIRAEMVDELRALPQGYIHALPFVIRAARERGYAIAAHGTFGRDLDLVAVPWTVDAVPAEELVAAVMVATNTKLTPSPSRVDPEVKPHGRRAWSLHFTDRQGVVTGAYIDLSVMPLAPDAPASQEGTAA